jgi:DNA replication protein DnaC
MSSSALDQKLATLKLARIREVYSSWVAHAEAHNLGYTEFLEELLNEELLGRQEATIRRKLKLAGFPFAATLENFDFSLRPELKRAVMVRFFDSAFVVNAQALLLIGPSGTGKIHPTHCPHWYECSTLGTD